MATPVVEEHPFAVFVPPRMTCLVVGSFPGKEQTRGGLDENAWFYGSPYNQFWRIVETAYRRSLPTKAAKQALFREAGIGLADVYRSVFRTQGSSRDENLQVVAYNTAEIERLLKEYRPRVLCTSRLVEKEVRRMFPAYTALDVLPSPSPRYFALSIEQKAEVYRKKLPPLISGSA